MRTQDRAVEAVRFRHAFRQVPAPVAVVLVRTAEGGVVGITCTSASSLSADPPMAMVAVDDKTGVMPRIEQAGRFSINYLAADRAAWSRAFAGRGQDMAALAHVIVPGRTPVPTLATGTVAVLECGLAAVHDGGDHSILTAHVLEARFQADAEPLIYRAGRYGTFG
ncbi:flavin reductase family protein [Amycolatopsis sp. GM8]|uniref:flavin reductase family protein n=1 Tax=Amycolatopsis sp. GM8 TaxID=2896530 RepID=UPI001F41CB26|nr:flavin reductase family protein [Amycolatopsis sp. GM8]